MRAILKGNAEAIAEEWMVWRLVLSEIATLGEIEACWSLDDLVCANMALTLHQETQRAR